MGKFVKFFILIAFLLISFGAGYAYGQEATYKKINDNKSIQDIYMNTRH
jgi:hypothetical protein